MTADVAVIGIGNGFRRDDGVGPAVAAAVEARAIPGVSVLIDAGDHAVVLDAWAGVRLAVWSTPRPLRHRHPAVSTAVPGTNASGRPL